MSDVCLEAMRQRAKREIASTYVHFYLDGYDRTQQLEARRRINSLRYVLGDDWYTWLYLWQRERDRAGRVTLPAH